MLRNKKLTPRRESNMKVVIINGYPGSGKDTFVSLCSKHYINVTNIVTSTPQKNALAELGWDGEKTPEARNMLADLKQQSNLVFNTTEKFVAGVLNTLKDNSFGEPVAFIHSREPEEIHMFKERYNGITIFVKREDHESPTNSSDMNVEDYDYDETILNDGTLEDLEHTATGFISILLGGHYDIHR